MDKLLHPVYRLLSATFFLLLSFSADDWLTILEVKGNFRLNQNKCFLDHVEHLFYFSGPKNVFLWHDKLFSLKRRLFFTEAKLTTAQTTAFYTHFSLSEGFFLVI